MKIELIFKKGLVDVATVTGVIEVKKDNLTLQEFEHLVTTVPTILEKVTGLRVHINEVF